MGRFRYAYLQNIQDLLSDGKTPCEKDRVTENGEKHSVIWGMFMSVTLELYSWENSHSMKKSKDLTMKQMFASARLVNNPLDPTDQEHSSGTIDQNERRHAHMQTARKKHQNAVYWVDIDLVVKKG